MGGIAKDYLTLGAQSGTISSIQPTVNLRFILRDGRRILQQAWTRQEGFNFSQEWRDIPLEVESKDG